MSVRKYFASIHAQDGCNLPTWPEAMTLTELGVHLEQKMAAYEHQGYFSNAKMERIPLHELSFTIWPEVSDEEAEASAPFVLIVGGGQ